MSRSSFAYPKWRSDRRASRLRLPLAIPACLDTDTRPAAGLDLPDPTRVGPQGAQRRRGGLHDGMVAVPHAMAKLVAAEIIPHTAAPRHGDAAGIIPCGRGPEPAARSASNSLRQHHQSAAEKLVSLSRGTAMKMAGASWQSSRG